MLVTDCEEQVEAVAANLNGDPTAAAFAGELMVMPPLVAGAGAGVDVEEGVELDGAEVDEVEDAAACVALVAAPPHPAATVTNKTSKESARALRFKKVTSNLPSCGCVLA